MNIRGSKDWKRKSFCVMQPNRRGSERQKRSERGFVLGLSLLLIVVLSISGLSFQHLDFLERRMVINETRNITAFYHANTGIERARETFKIPTTSTPSWTPILQADHPEHPAEYPTDLNSPDRATLCPFAETRGCVIPPFQTTARNSDHINHDGDPVTASDIPFAQAFDGGSYSARAFNNIEAGVSSTVDNDQILTFRALGNVNGIRKVIQVDIKAGLKGGVVNCQNNDPAAVCPDSKNDNTQIINMEGRDPVSLTSLPTWNRDFYRDTSHLPCSVAETITTGNVTLVSGPTSKPNERQMQTGHCYFATGDITVNSVGPGYDRVVVFSDKKLLVSGIAGFTHTILIALSEIQLQGNVETHSPDTYPALISGGDILKGNSSVKIFGNIYAEGSIGSEKQPWNPNEIHGAIYGDDVYLKAASTRVTDDNDPKYYALMPGFDPPPELKGTFVITKTWQEDPKP